MSCRIPTITPQHIKPVTPRVVVVDDESSSAAVIAKLLQRLGCEVSVCTDPGRALDLALSGEVDVVSLDLSMPGLDGYQLLSLIRSHEHSRRLPSVPVVTVTGHVAPSDQAQALAGGFAAHLAKPVRVDSLRSALARALTLRSELHRTRYTADREAIESSVRQILDRSPDGDVQTTAGLALALSQRGFAALESALLLAFEGQSAAARRGLDEFARVTRTLGARNLARCLVEMAGQLERGGDVLETAAVLARAELDRVIFTLREQLRH